MTDDAFLRAILDCPDDDTHRLVYSDWLEDHGDEEGWARAALIRAQCEAERLPPGDRRRKELEKEGRRIIRGQSKKWLGPLRKAHLGSGHGFQRGFLHSLTITPTQFVEQGEELFRLAPTVRSVRFPNAANEVTLLAGSPHLARLAEADLSALCSCGTCRIDRELLDLFASPHVANLTALSLAGDRIGPAGARALAASTRFTRLTSLDLSGNPLRRAGARALIASPWMGRLTRLDMRECQIPAGTLPLLSECFGDRVVL